MTAYVDTPIWQSRGQRWCHLLADSLDELHRFAAELGLRHEWFQSPPRASYPHYDINADTRLQAMRKGAVAADRRLIVAKARALRTELIMKAG